MLELEINGVSYLRWTGPYVWLRLLYAVFTRGRFTPEPGMLVCLQLSRQGEVTHNRQVRWDHERNDYAVITSKDDERDEPF